MAACQLIKFCAYEQTPDSPLEATNHKTYTIFSIIARLCNKEKMNATSAVGRVICIVLSLALVQFMASFRTLELVTEIHSHIFKCVVNDFSVHYFHKQKQGNRSCVHPYVTRINSCVTLVSPLVKK